MRVKITKSYIIFAVILAMAVAPLALFWFILPLEQKNSQVSGVEATDEKKEPKFISLSGRQIDEEYSQARLAAVVVENHPDSRPQGGLQNAEMVYEMVTEGGITRFLALFQEDVLKVGPIRSARSYFAEIADSYGAIFAHVGGSPEVLAKIMAGEYPNLTDLNEFFHADFFERIKTRKAPHNAYASISEIQSFANRSDDPPKSNLEFSDSASLSEDPATRVTVNFSKPVYLAEFRYDSVKKVYERFVAGEADIDANTGEQLSPTTLIVVETDIVPVGDSEGRMKIRLLGKGKAVVFSGGAVENALWSREAGKQFQYKKLDGENFTFFPGQIWIAVVSIGQAKWE